tara:strand:+ start:4923 stop:6227 length:1305 start_codon:yes stop_codon:yes gene_type:complete
MVNLPAAVDLPQGLQRGHLKKHIATVYIRGTLNPLERKLWNLLTKNALSNLAQERHEIPVSVLLRAANIHGNDRRILKPALIKLRQTSIEWIIQSEETGEPLVDSDWAESGFLSFVAISKGVVYYEYTKFVRERLRTPETYARIHIESQSKLSRGRSLPLYEMTARYRPNTHKKFKGKTPKWSLEFFRAAMGAEAPLYDDFRNLNQRIIKPSVAKINQGTDIHLEPIYHKNGRRCVAIQFSVRNNPQLQLGLDSEAPESIEIREQLTRYGLGEVEVDYYLKEYEIDYLKEKTNLLEARIRSGQEIHSVNGYLRAAIKEDYKLVDGTQIRKQQQKEAQKRRQEHAREQKEKVEAEKANEDARLSAEQQTVDAYLSTLSPSERLKLEQRFERHMQSNPISRQAWEKRDHGIYASVVNGSWRQYVLEQQNQVTVSSS